MSSPGPRTGLRADGKLATIAGVTPHLLPPGRARGAALRTCAPRDDLGSGDNRRQYLAGRELPARCAHLVAPRRLLAPSPTGGAPDAPGAAPPPGDGGPQPHLSPQPPPPPSQEPRGRLRNPKGWQHREPEARSAPAQVATRGGGSGTPGTLPGAAAAATAAPGRAASADSPPAGPGSRACGLGLARLPVWVRRGSAGAGDPARGGVTEGTAPSTPRLEAKCGEAGGVTPAPFWKPACVKQVSTIALRVVPKVGVVSLGERQRMNGDHCTRRGSAAGLGGGACPLLFSA